MKIKSAVPVSIKGTLIVPVGVFLVFSPYWFFLGGTFPLNLVLLFVIIPYLAAWLPRIYRETRNHFWESANGLILFYLFIVFMTFKQYRSEFFAVMMASAVWNILILAGIGLIMKFLKKTI